MPFPVHNGTSNNLLLLLPSLQSSLWKPFLWMTDLCGKALLTLMTVFQVFLFGYWLQFKWESILIICVICEDNEWPSFVSYGEVLSHFEEEFPEILSLTFQLWVTNKLSAYVCLKDRNLKKSSFSLAYWVFIIRKKVSQFVKKWGGGGSGSCYFPLQPFSENDWTCPCQEDEAEQVG